MVLQVTSLAPEMLNRCATPRALPTRKFAVEPDAPIDVKECCGIGLSSVGRRRPRERHSV